MPKLPERQDTASRFLQDDANRKYLIVKSNNIVQKTHYSMTLAQQKILASLIRSIKPNQTSLTVRFSTKQYMRMLGLHRSGTTFAGIMHTLKQISDKSFYMKLSDGKYHLFRWIGNIVANPNADEGGEFLVPFNPSLRQYLFSQSIKYRTIYKFSDIMLMRSRYSPRLFELFRSNESRQKVQKRGLDYKINELKYDLNLMKRNRTTGRPRHDKHGHLIFKYPSFSEFRRNVLEPAKRDINQCSEYNVKMRLIRSHSRGRKVKAVNVSMTPKNKQEKRKRDDRIFFITHHIPKSEWNTWREDTIRGKFHRVKPRKKKHKEVNGKFKVVKPKQKQSPSKADLKQIRNILDKHKIPFKEVNMGGNKLEYYNPWLDAYVWSTKKEWKNQYVLYLKQQEIKKKKQKIVKQFKATRARQNR